jgi:site-specific DNA-methyltransferase (adenine-specific)
MDIKRSLAVPSAFRQTALAFPEKVKHALALIDSPAGAKELLDQADTLVHYANRIKADTATVNAIQYGKLQIAARLGELLPATPRNETGRGNKKVLIPESRLFRPETISRYRRIAAHKGKIEAYYRWACSGNGDAEEMTFSGFLRSTREAARESQKQAKRQALNQSSLTAALGCSIILGDCCETLANLKAASARLVFADPPYNIGVDYGDGPAADRLSDSRYLDWCENWMKQAQRVLSADGSFWVLIGDEYAAEFGIILKRIGFTRRAWVKWYETFGVNCANNFNRCSRHLFYCVKDAKRFVFHGEAVNRPSDRQTKYADARANPGGKIWDDVWQIPRLVGTAKERIPDFPTQLPLALLRPIIGCASDPDDLVIDPFCGSGTTGAACLELGRHFLGIEKSRQFYNLATSRLLG